MNTVNCVKLNQQLEALERAPYPGELGKRILANVSKQGWQAWLDHQTMLINENNLNMLDEKAQSYLKQQMENFFFSKQGADDIQGYTPE
ncbi:FIG001341: Probable Fe(2+)-trafficking protein YggX [uncultured Candidatus Thioglobus sp.]|nr:FIG001341: Probable Fe(2+)-trafficking protein YggX [uncultured Candidatus Thioglobus sp.]